MVIPKKGLPTDMENHFRIRQQSCKKLLPLEKMDELVSLSKRMPTSSPHPSTTRLSQIFAITCSPKELPDVRILRINIYKEEWFI